MISSPRSAEQDNRRTPAAVDPQEARALLAFLEPAEAEAVAARGLEKSWPAGELVIDGESPADFLAFVLAGRLVVKKPASFPGRFVLLAEIERGGLVGEGAVVAAAGGLAGEAASAAGHGTVVAALEPSRLLVLPREPLRQLLADDPALALKLLARIVQVVRRRLHGASERLAGIL